MAEAEQVDLVLKHWKLTCYSSCFEYQEIDNRFCFSNFFDTKKQKYTCFRTTRLYKSLRVYKSMHFYLTQQKQA